MRPGCRRPPTRSASRSRRSTCPTPRPPLARGSPRSESALPPPAGRTVEPDAERSRAVAGARRRLPRHVRGPRRSDAPTAARSPTTERRRERRHDARGPPARHRATCGSTMLDVPEPAAGELLVRIEACGVCPTDARKYLIGVNDGTYPLNPGHEWVGRVEAVGAGGRGWAVGERVYGDTYAGYAESRRSPCEPGPWSCGPTRLPDDVPVERAVFVEPLADCLHAVHRPGAGAGRATACVVVGAGPMGLQMSPSRPGPAPRAGGGGAAGRAARAAARLRRRRRSRRPTGWVDACARRGRRRGDRRAPETRISSRPRSRRAATGGRVVLFAGFGDRPVVTVDLNDASTTARSPSSAASGSARRRTSGASATTTPRGCSARASCRLERLVTARCSFDGLEAALIGALGVPRAQDRVRRCPEASA